MSSQQRVKAAFLCNIALVTICIVCSIIGIGQFGAPFFLRFFTNLSNMFAGITCALTIPYCWRALKSSVLELPPWLVLLKQASATAVMITFTTVFLFLGFIAGHLNMIQGINLFFHMLSPLFMLLNFALFERGCTHLPEGKALLAAMIPVFLYGSVYMAMVVFIGKENGGWPDFYYFNMNGMWPVTLVVMLAVTALLGLLVWRLAGGKKTRS